MLLICVLLYYTNLVFRSNALAWPRSRGASRPKEIPAVPQLEDQKGEMHRVNFHSGLCGEKSSNFINPFSFLLIIVLYFA